MSQLPLAYLAGLVVLLNPCVLPILPILIGSALGESRYGPAALAGGLGLSFSLFGFLILAVGFQIGLDGDTARTGAAIAMLALGLLLLSPRAQSAFASLAGPLANFGNRRLARMTGRGVGGQFAIGLLLGLVWSPCVGPVLGVAIASAGRGENLAAALATFIVFSAGVVTVMLALAYAARRAIHLRGGSLDKIARYSKPALGIMLLIIAALILSGLDKRLEAGLLAAMPDWLIALTVRF